MTDSREPESPGGELPGGDTAGAASVAGRAIGPYRLVRLLGRGGMGAVYEATQESPRRSVALKVMAGGPHVDAAARRMFQRECDSLGRLRHPSIAAIYASGATEDGQPWLAMELVAGRPLERYLKEEGPPRTRVDLARRLGIFRSIAGAVAYAHQRGVIHRDLKPSNILVVDAAPSPAPVGGVSSATASSTGGLPEIKVLDFGLARIVDPDPEAATAATVTGRIEGTLPYMSPEQVRGGTDAADARTDVYALGVLLYRMLSGRLPFEVESASFPEAVRTICETEAPSLSVAGTGVRIDRDLALIARKALEKDPARRYDTVAALDDDIGRWLEGQTILARPPSAAYQLRRLVARHKAAFAAGALLALALAAFTAVMIVQARRIARERDRATRESATARQVSAFLTNLFSVSDPSEARGGAVTAREILDRGVTSIGRDLADQPEVQARLLTTLSGVYQNLGLWSTAKPLTEQALAIRRRLLGDEHPDTLYSREALAYLEGVLDHRDVAERIYTEVAEVRRRLLGEEDPATLRAVEGIAWTEVFQAKYTEAERLYRQALDARLRTQGEDHPETLLTMGRLADLYRGMGRFPESEALYLRVIAGYRKTVGEDNLVTLSAQGYLATVYTDEGKLREAEALFRETLERMDRVLGKDHPLRLTTFAQLGSLYDEQERYPEAEAIHREVLEKRLRLFGPDHSTTRNAMNNLANALSMQGHYVEAEALLKETLEGDIRLLGIDHPDTTRTRYNLACTAALRGDRAEALHWLREAVAHGYNRPKSILGDDDLKSLRGSAEFKAILARAQANADKPH